MFIFIALIFEHAGDPIDILHQLDHLRDPKIPYIKIYKII